MTPAERALKDILDAFQIEGSHPEYHRQQKAALARTWPSLSKAIIAAQRVDVRASERETVAFRSLQGGTIERPVRVHPPGRW